MSWLTVAPVALVCAAWLFVPGLMIGYAMGLRGIAAWGLGPTLSVAVVATTATVAGSLGVAWSGYLVAAAAFAVAVLIGGCALLLRRRVAVVGPADPRPTVTAAAVGLLVAILLGATIFVLGVGAPDTPSQTFDAVFHYSAVSSILDTRNGSPLAVGTLGDLSVPGVFYPAAWHDLAALLVLSSGTSVLVAANLLSGTIAVLCWPMACVLLVRQIVGRSPAAMAITGVLSLGFVAFPWSLLSFGVLWPNTLGLSLVPAALGLLLSILGLAKHDAIGRPRAWLLMPVTLVAQALSHPNAVFTFATLAIYPTVAAAVIRAVRLHRTRHTVRGLGQLAAVVLGIFVLWVWAAKTPALAAVRHFHWAPFETTAQAVGEVILLATNGRAAHWLLAILVLVGFVVGWRSPDRRWLVAGFVATGALFTLTASVNVPETQKFTGYWYNDSFRLAAMLPITAVPLAVCAVMHLAERIHDRLGAQRETLSGFWTGRGRYLARLDTSTGIAVTITVILLLATDLLYLPNHRATLRGAYPKIATDHTRRDLLVDGTERAFLISLRDRIPARGVVANNPWDGSTLLWPLTGRRPLFGNLTPVLTDDRRYLADHLVDAGTDPSVCQAAERLGVGYMVLMTQNFWVGDPRIKLYPGIVDPQDRPGFELVASDGALKLFRLAACATPTTMPR